jgi:predicted DNA-binding ribbon-helix-helix protein
MSIRLPNSLHDAARELAKKEDISVNQLITSALAEKVAALRTVDYLRQRAEAGSMDEFRRIMGTIPHVEPEPFDRL